MSLVSIAPPPTAQNAVILLHPKDNVGIARASLPAGQEVQVDGQTITLLDPIPAGHKVALRSIAALLLGGEQLDEDDLQHIDRVIEQVHVEIGERLVDGLMCVFERNRFEIHQPARHRRHVVANKPGNRATTV
mgnify:CR=1 FL=1